MRIQDLNEEDVILLTEMMRSAGWKIFEALSREAANDYRNLATQRTIALEDRLWYSALANGREEGIVEILDLLKKIKGLK